MKELKFAGAGCGKKTISVNGLQFGGGRLQIIAGPCAIESEKQIIELAKSVKAAGATVLRGGTFKNRTYPYDFQGLREEGVKYLAEAKKETGLPVISEITAIRELPCFEEIDIIQIGARNMQNYELLKEVAKTGKPVLLKRGFSNTLEELLYSAEYIMDGGDMNVILCERGIRTFEQDTRNTMDISAVPRLHDLSCLPVIADPSHATGKRELVEPMSLAAVAAGADGLIIEVHENPEAALSDGRQAITPEMFAEIVRKAGILQNAMKSF